MLAHAPIYIYVCQHRCASVRACVHAIPYSSHIRLKSKKQSHSPPAHAALSVTGTYRFLPCVHLVLEPVSSLGLATNAARTTSGIPLEIAAKRSSRRSVSLVARRTSALQTAERFALLTGSARPWQVTAGSQWKPARQTLFGGLDFVFSLVSSTSAQMLPSSSDPL